MTNWTPDEASILKGRWRHTASDTLVVIGSCPSTDTDCGHNAAFKVEVDAQTSTGVAADETEWPSTYPVACECNQHDGDGCGKSGEIEIPDPVPADA